MKFMRWMIGSLNDSFVGDFLKLWGKGKIFFVFLSMIVLKVKWIVREDLFMGEGVWDLKNLNKIFAIYTKYKWKQIFTVLFDIVKVFLWVYWIFSGFVYLESLWICGLWPFCMFYEWMNYFSMWKILLNGWGWVQ